MDYWEWIGRFDSLFGILTVLFSGYAAYRLWRQDRRYRALANEIQGSVDLRQRIQDYKGVQTKKPVALPITLLPAIPSIENNVKTYLKSNKLKMPIENEIRIPGINGSGDLEQLVKEVQGKKIKLQGDGFTEVHLFLAGPIAAGLVIGSLLNNWIPVKVYHKPTPSPADVYEYWMPLLKI